MDTTIENMINSIDLSAPVPEYEPMISTNVSASVKVEPWNVKTIHEEVE